MNKKGFTLIELLAVIVILAIIALIATPIVLSIINDSKESASLRSAEMYLDAVEQSISIEKMNNISFNPRVCTVAQNGNLDCEGYNKNPIEVKVNGEVPEEGSTITFEKVKIKEIELKYSNNITIVKNDEGILIYGEKEKTLDDICKYANNGVAEKTAGAKYSCEVKEGVSYNFYVLTTPAEGSKTINLIMDRNMCSDGTPTDANKSDKCLVTYNLAGDALGVGPVTAMAYLNNATSTWENIPNLNLKYNDEGGNFTDFEITGKARMPYLSEISKYDDTNKTNAYLYDYLKLLGTIQTNQISGIIGYWTLSSVTNVSNAAKFVYFRGYIRSDNVDYDSDDQDFNGIGGGVGVRPVITLKI